MKLTLTAILVTAAFSLQACTSTYDLTTTPRESHPWMETKYQTYSAFLSEAKAKTVRIVLTSGKAFLATLTRADGDSIGWTGVKDATTEEVHNWLEPAQAERPQRTDSAVISAGVVPTSGVHALEISHNYWWQGGLLGFLAVAVPTVAAGQWNVSSDNNGHTPVFDSLSKSLGMSLLGAGLGIVVGGVIHSTDQYLTGTNASPDTTRSH